MTHKEQVELQAKQTIGYAEAKNKESFLVGVTVSFFKTSAFYEKEIESLRKQLEIYKSTSNTYLNDLKTITSIIKHYSGDE